MIDILNLILVIVLIILYKRRIKKLEKENRNMLLNINLALDDLYDMMEYFHYLGDEVNRDILERNIKLLEGEFDND